MITTPEPTLDLVEAYRERAELPRARLARLSGVSVQTLHRFRRGEVERANTRTLRALADTLADYVDESGDAIYAQLEARYVPFKSPEFGLRYYRQLAGMTQQELADAVGVSLNNIASYERYAKQSTSAVTALRAARVLASRLKGKLDHSEKDILYNIAVQMEARLEPVAPQV